MSYIRYFHCFSLKAFYGVKVNNLNRLKTLKIVNNIFNNIYVTTLAEVNCGFSQGPIIAILSVFVYVKDLSNTLNMLEPIMFADNINVLLSLQNINTLKDQWKT